MSTALVVDDERQMTMIVEYALANQGFTVHTAHDGATALNLLRTHEVDLVVLDVRMPTIDGLDLCERIRAGSDVPIMLLTALAQPEDVIAGLERGADDYVTKPFHPKELVLRAQALVRRYRGGGDGRVLRNGELVIDPVRREVTVAGRRLTLSYTEFRLLYCLTARRGEALSWRRLLREVWGTDNLIGGRELVKATVAILRTLHHEGRVSHVDDVYAFDDVAVEPRPGPLEIWYCGSAPAAARLAVDLGLAWLPGRITLDTITARRAAMEARASDAGVAVPKVGVIAPTSIAATRDRALEGLDVDGLLDWANTYGRWWVKPASGRFQTRADLKGSLIAGSPDDVASEVADFQAAGVDHLVFDLRSRFDRWFESIDLLASEVLPRFREAAA